MLRQNNNTKIALPDKRSRMSDFFYGAGLESRRSWSRRCKIIVCFGDNSWSKEDLMVLYYGIGGRSLYRDSSESQKEKEISFFNSSVNQYTHIFFPFIEYFFLYKK